MDKLKQDLLLNYDKFARPSQHYNTTNVKFGITIVHLQVNELKSTLTVNAWIRMEWKDDKLQWSPNNYGNIEKVNFGDHEIWQPDVVLYNSATPNTHYGGFHCIVFSSGVVIWVPPVVLNVLCEFNFQYWPFDTQVCIMKFGSWTYHGEEINVNIYDEENAIELERMINNNSEWEIIKTEAKKNTIFYKCCKEPYTDATFTLTLSRKSPSYRALIITPAIVVILLILSTFWLPPHLGEKLILNGITAIIITFFLMYFTQKLPAMGSHVPSIVSFYSSSLHMVSFAVIESVLVLWLSRTKHKEPLPWSLKSILSGSFGKNVLRLNTSSVEVSNQSQRVQAEELREHHSTEFEEHNSNDEHHMIKSTKASLLQNDWILLAVAIDRSIFYLYSILFIILAIVYSV